MLGVFFAAQYTASEPLNQLSALLLPPGDPPRGYNPQKELQHACSVAEQFLAGGDATIFDQLQGMMLPPLSPRAFDLTLVQLSSEAIGGRSEGIFSS